MTVSVEFRSNANDHSLASDTVLQDRYRIVRQLGRGGMGAVYEAVDERLGITVALKETLSSDVSTRKQFEQEARLLASMLHPALPRVSDHFIEGKRAFLVMQFIGGVDLAKIIARQPGPFPRDQVIAWADQLLDALIYLHSRDRQVIHRDIKPHNLKLTANGQIALLDFGLAKAQPADQSQTASRAFFGYTKHYAPLEQIQDQRTDQRSDIYALGATLYHLLTGIKPPDALIRATALINGEVDPLKPADHIHAAVGPQIAAILGKAMSQKSEDRFANATEFREALRRMGRTKPVVIQESAIDSKVDEQRGVAQKDPPVMKLPMVVSGRRFGPAGVTAILVIACAISMVLYEKRPWSNLSTETTAAQSPDAVLSDRRIVSARLLEKPRAQENNLATVQARDRFEPNHQEKTERVTKPKREHAAVPESPHVGRQPLKNAARALEPGDRQTPKVPGIRFPTLGIGESRSTASDGTVRNYGSTGGPRFYRTIDGTQIVKFWDGSSRVIKPGERMAH